MPKNLYPNNILKRQSAPKKKKFFVGFFLVISLLLCLSFANLFSDFITTGYFVLSNTNEIKSSAFTIFAISTKKSALKEEVESFASDQKRKGGAGYIWSIDGLHYLMASCYANENDAKKVQESLTASGVNCEVVKLSFESITVSMEMTQSDKQSFLNAVGLFKTTYLSLYDIAVALDTKVSSDSECLASMGNIKANVEKIRQAFNQTFTSKLTKDLIQVRLSLASCKEIIENLSSYSGDNLSSEIKNSYFKILKLNSNLYDDINDKI